MWVAYYGANDHLVRVDPSTGEMVDDIVVDTSPSWEVGGGGITVADGSVWITGSVSSKTCPDSSGPGQAGLVQVDVATDRPVATVCLGGAFGADVAVDANGVWVLIFTSGPGADPMQIVHLDPSTLQILGRIDLAETYGHRIFAVGDAVVAGVNETANSTIGDSVLAIVDPATATLRDEVHLTSYAFFSADGDQLWATTGDGLERLNPLTGSVVAGPFDVLSTGDFIGAGAGGVWLLDPEHDRSLFRVDPETGKLDLVAEVSGKFEWNDVAFSPDAIWGLGYDGELHRLELSPRD